MRRESRDAKNRRAARSRGLLLALLAGLLPGCLEPTSVIFITVDTLRADRLGSYGYFRDTSPAVDALAAEGVLFERAITTMATTLPAHASLMTSTYPARHGVVSNFNVMKTPLTTDAGLRTAAQVFRDAGYATAAFVAVRHLDEESGISAGFDTFDAPENQRIAEDTSRAAIEWVRSGPARPFFLWVHYFDPHYPYAPPESYRTYRSDEQQAAAVRASGVAERHVEMALALQNLYDGEVRYTDDQIAVLLEALREVGVYDHAIVVFTADHGEGLMEHGLREHGVIFNEQIFVPLVIKFPAGDPRVGIRRSDVVSLIDVLPSVTGSLSLPVEPGWFDGIDLFRARRRSALVQREYTRRRYGTEANWALTDGRWKYFMFTERPDELYDLANDFEELHNVIADHSDVAWRLRTELVHLVGESRARATPSPRAKPGLSPERREALKGLGYVE